MRLQECYARVMVFPYCMQVIRPLGLTLLIISAINGLFSRNPDASLRANAHIHKKKTTAYTL